MKASLQQVTRHLVVSTGKGHSGSLPGLTSQSQISEVPAYQSKLLHIFPGKMIKYQQQYFIGKTWLIVEFHLTHSSTLLWLIKG